MAPWGLSPPNPPVHYNKSYIITYMPNYLSYAFDNIFFIRQFQKLYLKNKTVDIMDLYNVRDSWRLYAQADTIYHLIIIVLLYII